MKNSTRLAATSMMLAMLAACAQAPVKAPVRATRTAAAPAAAAPAANSAVPARMMGEVRARYETALGLVRAQQWNEAETAMLALTRDAPTLSGPWTNLGILRARRKDWSGAITAFSGASTANPRNVTALNWLGTCLRTAGEPAKAEAAYLRALATDPDDAQTHLNLAVLYDLSLKKPQQALEHYRASQRDMRERSPIVQAWIRDLETPAPRSTLMLGSAP